MALYKFRIVIIIIINYVNKILPVCLLTYCFCIIAFLSLSLFCFLYFILYVFDTLVVCCLRYSVFHIGLFIKI